MKTTKEIGDSAEKLAALHLEDQGYRIIDRNFRSQMGEIDIIALDGDTLVFVEVKKKTTGRFGAPGEMITPQKLNRIRRTGEYFISEKGLGDVDWRIDAVLIDGSRVETLTSITS